jgi:outer membrane protein assembly factor BamA
MKLKILVPLFLLILGSEVLAQTSDQVLTTAKRDSIRSAHQLDSIRQVDLVDYLVRIFKIKNSEQKRDNNKVKFSLFPTTTTTTADRTVVTSFNAAFLLGDIKNTNISTVYFYPYIAFNGQYGIQLTSNIWLNRNSWNFVGEYFALNYPQYTWGLGGNSPDESETLINFKHIRFYQNAMKGIFPHIALGLGYSYDRHFNIHIDDESMTNAINHGIPVDTFNTISSGIALPAIFDNRNNPINSKRGWLLNSTYYFFLPALGSDDAYQSLFLDLRRYFTLPVRRSPVLAFRSYYWTITKGMAPYLDLPANRWEPATGSASRGIQKNRYRSNAMLYFESEYRFGISKNGLWGGVLFADVLSASEYQTQNFRYWHPAGGAGVRLKLNKYSGTNVGFDVGASKGFASVYLFIGEAF